MQTNCMFERKKPLCFTYCVGLGNLLHDHGTYQVAPSLTKQPCMCWSGCLFCLTGYGPRRYSLSNQLRCVRLGKCVGLGNLSHDCGTYQVMPSLTKHPCMCWIMPLRV